MNFALRLSYSAEWRRAKAQVLVHNQYTVPPFRKYSNISSLITSCKRLSKVLSWLICIHFSNKLDPFRYVKGERKFLQFRSLLTGLKDVLVMVFWRAENVTNRRYVKPVTIIARTWERPKYCQTKLKLAFVPTSLDCSSSSRAIRSAGLPTTGQQTKFWGWNASCYSISVSLGNRHQTICSLPTFSDYFL